MIIHKLDSTKIDNREMEALLSMFRNSSATSDYMAIGEIDTLETLHKVLNNKNLIHFIAYEDNVPVAYCQIVYKSESVNFNSGAKINAISVLPSKRGNGLGGAILHEAILDLKKNNTIKNIYLDVVKDNTTAVNLYKKLGFEKTGELKNIFTKDNTLMDIEIYSLLVN
jgi:ribosomal protein S18 acetylase RimI-like enzyme